MKLRFYFSVLPPWPFSANEEDIESRRKLWEQLSRWKSRMSLHCLLRHHHIFKCLTLCCIVGNGVFSSLIHVVLCFLIDLWSQCLWCRVMVVTEVEKFPSDRTLQSSFDRSVSSDTSDSEVSSAGLPPEAAGPHRAELLSLITLIGRSVTRKWCPFITAWNPADLIWPKEVFTERTESPSGWTDPPEHRRWKSLKSSMRHKLMTERRKVILLTVQVKTRYQNKQYKYV